MAQADDFFASIVGYDLSARLVTQSDMKEKMGCVPTAMFYTFKLGGPHLNSLYKALPGSNDAEKLRYVMDFGKQLPVKAPGVSHPFVFDSEKGTPVLEKQNYVESLAGHLRQPPPKLSYLQAHRRQDETVAGSLVQRIHGHILEAIENATPVNMGVNAHATGFSDNLSDSIFFHNVVVVDVQRQISRGELGFMIQYLDPNTGQKKTAMIYEEINTPFNATIWGREFEKGSSWSRGKYGVNNYANKFISSPYLKITAPTLMPYKSVAWEESVVVFVTDVTVFAP